MLMNALSVCYCSILGWERGGRWPVSMAFRQSYILFNLVVR